MMVRRLLILIVSVVVMGMSIIVVAMMKDAIAFKQIVD